MGLSAPHTAWRVRVFWEDAGTGRWSWWWICHRRRTWVGGARVFDPCPCGVSIRGGFWTPALARKAALVHIREAHRCPGQWERDATGWWTMIAANAQEANMTDAGPRGLRYGPRAVRPEPQSDVGGVPGSAPTP